MKTIRRLVLASVLFAALGAVATTNAQSAKDPGSASAAQVTGGGAGFFSVGAHVTDISALNDRLQAAGYPTFGSEMIAVGGGGYGFAANRLLLGGEGYGLLSGDAGYQGRTVSVGAGYGLFTLGYVAHSGTRIRAYPQLGLGGGGLILDIGSADADRFDDVLENPSRSATLGTANMILSLGAGLEYHFRDARADGGLLIGLRAGYLFAPLSSDWSLDETSLSGGPDASMGGPFVRLIVGGGGVETGNE